MRRTGLRTTVGSKLVFEEFQMWVRNTATLLCEVMTSFLVAFSRFWNTVVLFLSSLCFSKWLLLRFSYPVVLMFSDEIMSVFKVFDSSTLNLGQSEFYCSTLERVVRKLCIHFSSSLPLMWTAELNFSKCRFSRYEQCSQNSLPSMGTARKLEESEVRK